MKVQIGIFECTGIMGQDLVHPYIQSTTVLFDAGSQALYKILLYMHISMFSPLWPCLHSLAYNSFIHKSSKRRFPHFNLCCTSGKNHFYKMNADVGMVVKYEK